MKTVCLYFEIHQNIHLKRYRFFDIGTDHYYYDDYENERSIQETAERSYVPALQALLEMAGRYGSYFKCAISLSGSAIELLERYAPQVLDLLSQLNETGCVEFLAEPYSHGFSSMTNRETFREEVKRLCKKIKTLFGKEPKVFRNSCLIYSDEIGQEVADMGFKGMLAEGAKHVLGWKSPHFVYHCNRNPKLKLLLRDPSLSEDISYRFNDSSWSEYPLFADTYAKWIADLPEDEQVVNIFMELCALGIFQPLSSNILEFMKSLPEQLKERGVVFSTPSEICSKMKSAGELNVAYPTSWVDEERDLSPWLGNDMQREALDKLYSLADRVRIGNDKRLKQDFDYLQASNNFRFMSTKANSYGGYRGIYDSPYDAFTNFMNILGDFNSRINNLYPEFDNDELNSLLTTIKNQDEELERKDKEIEKLQHLLGQLEEMEGGFQKAEAKPVPEAAPAAPAKKAASKAKAEAKPAAKKTTPKAKAEAKPAAKKAAPKAKAEAKPAAKKAAAKAKK
ncbi:MAG: glycoside hydrolase family 57 protein [Bacteroidaceae bacterium]|nr:glycoside hydrolase family 57 protein [Bacteroidaceae bacterium]